MANPKRLGSRTGWIISGALLVLSAWFVIPAIGQRVALSEVTPRPVTPRGDLGADEKSTIDLFQKARASVVYINTRERVLDPWTRVVPQFIARGKYIRPGLGIAVDEGLNRAAMQQLRVEGVLILRVTPGSPAAAVGLRGAQLAADGSMVPGDIIVAVDGRPVESVARLLARLDDHQVGDGVSLTILRDGRKLRSPWHS
jgi:membrane-associated protease RseP (regulator of RpoE activity)